MLGQLIAYAINWSMLLLFLAMLAWLAQFQNQKPCHFSRGSPSSFLPKVNLNSTTFGMF
jgi:hypothetical protein